MRPMYPPTCRRCPTCSICLTSVTRSSNPTSNRVAGGAEAPDDTGADRGSESRSAFLREMHDLSEVVHRMSSFIGRCSIAVALGLGLALGRASVGDSAEPSPPREFSAYIVNRDAAGAIVGGSARLYASGRNVRIETPEVPAG